MQKRVLDFLCDILGQEEWCSRGEEDNRFVDEIAKLYGKFTSSLHGAELADFENLCQSYDGANAYESEYYFRLGFKFAVRMMAECMVQS